MLPHPRILIGQFLLPQRAADDSEAGCIERHPLAHRGREPGSVGHSDGNGH